MKYDREFYILSEIANDDMNTLVARAIAGRHRMRVKLIMKSRLVAESYGIFAAVFDDALTRIIDDMFREIEDVPTVVAYSFDVAYGR
ncbi:MAG: hypothetical protein DRH17_13290 [Deltaproteobacteria bacterium]|nr:MAG: hypothetical protein DRH17_13290 [Deltaproteobacteria bacterium]